MSTLILLRHGQSVWNANNLFTGWVDVPLTTQGIEEALAAGDKIKNIPIDVIYTTPLIRASMTAMLAMSRHSSGRTPVILHPEGGKLQEWGQINSEKIKEEMIPVHEAWQLNERMYGDLQGMNKDETREKYGAEQVHIWRRSYDTRPPEGESLELTASRSIPYFKEKIVPELEKGKNVFVSAHGNSLRSIVMQLDGLSHDEVLSLEIATGDPIIYEFDNGQFTKKS